MATVAVYFFLGITMVAKLVENEPLSKPESSSLPPKAAEKSESSAAGKMGDDEASGTG